MTSPFTIKTLRFLRALKRNNDREWFRARKAQYEADVRQPMIALIERLAADFKSFAPEFVAEPKVSLYRIYRDTRFSADKTPLKTHAAAHFPMRGLPKGEGGGLYFEIAPAWVWVGGGLYMPSNPQLHVIRAHIAASHPRFHRLVTGGSQDPDELGKLAVFAGVSEFPVRVKCASLAWHTLKAALEGARAPVTTE